GHSLSLGRVRVCLDVFAEQGLIDVQCCKKYYTIRITTDGRKVDLDASPIIRTLRAVKSR
ncbi:MAG: hypothetical protein II106_06745, partial [Oscillospiraceae bacterium]|nr:hypothetical protein [Oscillospiraceae bacterium]